MKVCIFGNSHLGALKQALDRGVLQDEDIDIVFFGAHGKRFRKLRFRKGYLGGPREIRKVLLTVSDGRYSRIDPKEFDAIILHSGSLYLHVLVGGIYRRMERDGHFYSSGFIRAGIEQWLTSSETFRLGKAIRQETGTRVILSPKPCPADDRKERGVFDSKPPRSKWQWKTMPAEFRRSIWTLCADIARQHGLEFVPQPEETLTANQYTQLRFTKGSTRLLSGRHHEDIDTSHMNADYGELVMRRLIETLRNEIPPAMPDDAIRNNATRISLAGKAHHNRRPGRLHRMVEIVREKLSGS